ncbi:MAG: hypothetical protein QM765_16115 [Myxococcales bacterium]
MTSLNKLALLCCLTGLSFALTGCPNEQVNPDHPDAKVAPPGKDASVTCTPTPCGDKECGTDGCGHECGACGPGTTCNEATWKCDACSSETKAEFCSRVAKAGKVCGSITDEDNCTKTTRTEDCGGCTNGKTCAADNTCTGSCSYEGDSAFCARLGKDCGSVTAADNCTETKTVNCGVCSGQCVDNVCNAAKPCGNGTLDEGEDCDKTNLNGKTCITQGFASGMLLCNADCTFNTSNCVAPEDCGNGVIDGTEKCDKANLNGKTCVTEGFASGTLKCNANCTLNTEDCVAATDCGNGTVNTGEQCDGANLDNKTCQDLGFAGGGTLSCSAGCQFVTTLCIGASTCGNGNIDSNEECDKTNLNSKTCVTEGFTAGVLTCNADCTLNKSGCNNGGPPANDDCATAIDITTATMPVNGYTTGGTDNSYGTCEGDWYYGYDQHDGADVVYSFEITGTDPKNVEISLNRLAGTTYQPVFYVRSDCASSSASLELACEPYTSGGSYVRLKNVAPGKYYIIVDGEDETEGDFQLNVGITTPPPPPTNDNCGTAGAGATELTFVGDVANTTGTTLSGTDDYQGSCKGSSSNKHNGGDVVYKLTIPAGTDQSITAVVTPSSSGLKPAVYIWSACDSAAPGELACRNASSAGGIATAMVLSAPAGQSYYVVVDGLDASEGDFELQVALGAPIVLPDTCASPQPITLAASGSGWAGSASGDNSIATADTKGTCMSAGTPPAGKDLVYELDTTGLTAADKDLKATVTFQKSGYYARLYIRKDCASELAADELGCLAVTQTTGSVTAKHLVPGKYYIWVDSSYASDEGPFTLDVVLTDSLPAPTNDTCGTAGDGAEELVFAADVATATGKTTAGGVNNYQGACKTSSNTHDGGDVVFKFTVPGAVNRSATVVVTPDATSTTYKPAVYVWSACDPTAPGEKACINGATAGGATTVTANSLTAGQTYYVVVDGNGATEGSFDLQVTLGAEIFFPDTCSDVLAVDVSGLDPLTGDGTLSITGDTTNATNSGSALGSCGGISNDLVYALTLDPTKGNKNLTVTMTFNAATTQNPVVYLRKGACTTTTASDELKCAVNSTGTSASFSVRNVVAGQTYYLWADGYASSKGPFTIAVDVVTPAPAPGNDLCGVGGATATELAFSGDVATLTGGTSAGGNDDYKGACADTSSNKHDGSDVVYKFTIPGSDNRSVTAVVTPTTSTFKPAVYIREVCDATGSATCGNATAAGSPATATAMSLAAGGTYYVVVDGANGSEGTFDLSVTLGAPIVLPDTCASPQTITLTANGSGWTGSVSGNNLGATADTKGTCMSAVTAPAGKDLVYELDTTGLTAGDKDLLATVSFQVSNYYARMYIRKDCASELATDELGCLSVSQATGSITAKHLAPGKYYIWVDSSYTADEGPFTLNVALTDSLPAPTNDTCGTAGDGAEELVFASDVATATARTTGGGVNNYQGSCKTSSNTHDGSDVVFKFTVPGTENRSATVLVTPNATSSTFKPAIYLWSACDPAASGEKACINGATAGAATTLTANSLAPGQTYYLFVDGNGATEGGFDLQVTLGAETFFPDTCNDVVPVDVSGLDPVTGDGTLAITGDTTNATNSGAALGTCGGSGNDLVYSLTLDPTKGNKDLTVTMTFNAATTQNPVVYLRKGACTTTTASDELKCASNSSGTSTSFSVRNVLAGHTYYLWADGYSSSKGPFTIAVDVVTPAPAPANDLCGVAGATATELAFSGDVATVTGATSVAANNDYQGACGGSGPDVVYKFTIPGTDSRSVTAVVTPTTSTFKPVVYIRDVCDAAGSLSCRSASAAGAAATATALSLAAGQTYYVVVDSDGTEGAFDLSVTLGTAINIPDDCSGVQALDTSGLVDGNGVITVSGDTSQGTHNTLSIGSCGVGQGPDLVYSLTTTTEKAITVAMQFTSSTSATAVTYLRKGACTTTTATDELGCDDGSGTGATFTVSHLAAGTYFIWADGYSTSSGPFTLTVTLAEPPAVPSGDTCDASGNGAQEIPLTFNGTAYEGSVAGDNSAATANTKGTCMSASTPPTGKDLVYLVDTTSLPGNKNITATVNFQKSSYYSRLYIRKDNCASELAADEVACLANSSTSGTIVARQLPPAKYYVWVDSSYSSDEGAFTLTISAVDSPPPPTNDACGTEVDLGDLSTGPLTATGSTDDASASTTSANAGSCAFTTASGGDVVYKFTTGPALNKVKVTLVGTGNLKPLAYVRTTCDDATAAAQVACNYSSTAAGTTTFNFTPTTPATTYYVWVDGYSSSSGGYTLTVEELIPPANDACGAETDLGDLSTGPKTATGSTEAANASTTSANAGSCAFTTASGGDAVYSFTTGASLNKVKVTLVGTGTLKPLAYVRTTCDDATAAAQVGCNYSSTAAGTTTFSFTPAAPSTTYYVWVDGYSSSVGGYTLTVEELAPPTNDACGAETDLGDISTGPKTATGGTEGANASTTSANTGSCAFTTASGGDVVYKFTTGAALNKVKVTLVGTGTLKPLAYVRTTCDDATTAAQVGCNYSSTSAGTTTFNFTPAAPSTTYYLWVDGYSSSAGGYTLTVEEMVPPANDTCGAGDANAIELTLGAAPTSGDTSLASADYGGALSSTCKTGMGSYNAPGNDVVYKYIPTAAGSFTIEVKPSSWDCAVWYTEAACGGDGANCVNAADKAYSGGTETLTVLGQAGVTYFIYVDRYNASSVGGAFTIQIK